DVKPSNLMLTPQGLVKLFDLGLARLVNTPTQEAQITLHGQFLGTVDYVAPEQCDNSRTVDTRADLYSLGCTLYHLLAGDPPFATPGYDSVYRKLMAHAAAPVPPVRGRSDIPEPLAAALGRLRAKARNARSAARAEVASASQPSAAGAALPRLLPPPAPPAPA